MNFPLHVELINTLLANGHAEIFCIFIYKAVKWTLFDRSNKIDIKP